jgi:tetratricopeptide (TPR) repeat protein
MPEKDFSEIAKLSERYNKDPKSRIFVQLADAYRKNGMIDEALEILNKGLDYHPDYALGHLILGKCRFDKRMFAQAKESFERTLEKDPQNIVAMRMLAQTCENLKDEDGQLAAYKGLLALDPFDAQAKEKLSRLEALHKTQPTHTLSMAQEYEKQGDTDNALKVYEHLLLTDPSDIVLKKKVTELKEKISAVKKETEEKKLAEMQLESYFSPSDVDKPTQKTQPTTKPPTPTPKEKTVIPEPVPQEAPVPTPPPLEEPAPSEDVLPLEDFLSETPEKTPPSEESPREPKPEEPAPTTLDEAQQPSQPGDASKLDILEPFTPEGPGETSEKLDIVKPTESAERVAEPPFEPKPVPIQETPPQEDTVTPFTEEPPIPIAEEKPVLGEQPAPTEPQAPEETEDLSDLLQEAEPAQTPTPAEQTPVPPPGPVEHGSAEKLEVEPVAEDKQTQPETPSSTPSVSAAPEVQPLSSTPEQPRTEKEEPKKPKEEDFQSFQDWLSGLLK